MAPANVNGIMGALFNITAFCGYGAAVVVGGPILERPLFCAPLPALAPTQPPPRPPSPCGPSGTACPSRTAVLSPARVHAARRAADRETNDNCYGPKTYYAYKLIQEGFLCIFTSLFFVMAIYWAVQLQGSFGVYVLAYYLISMTSMALAYAISALAPTVDSANAMLPTYVTTVMFVAGVIMPTEEIPDQWAWYGWTSFIRYGWAAMMLNQFEGQPNGEAKVALDTDGTPITILDFFGLEGDVLGNKWACIGMLTTIFLLFVTCGLGVITNVRHERR